MSGERLVIQAYDPSWPAEFERLRERAEAALGDLAVAIEHVGSTAVPGLAGKPVIDIDVVIASPDHVEPALDRLVGAHGNAFRRRGRVGCVG